MSKNVFSYIDENFNTLDVLVNNARCETIVHAINLDLKVWNRIFDVNLKGAWAILNQILVLLFKSNLIFRLKKMLV